MKTLGLLAWSFGAGAAVAQGSGRPGSSPGSRTHQLSVQGQSSPAHLSQLSCRRTMVVRTAPAPPAVVRMKLGHGRKPSKQYLAHSGWSFAIAITISLQQLIVKIPHSQ